MSRGTTVWLTLLLVVLGVAGCKKYSVECELVVTPYTMVQQGSPKDSPADGTRIYVFYNLGKDKKDVERWRPTTWSDAQAGVIRLGGTGDIRSHSLVAEQGVGAREIRITVSSSPMLLVAVDQLSGVYAWRVAEYRAPMDHLYSYVRFQPWRKEKPYIDRETGWKMASAAWEALPPEQPSEPSHSMRSESPETPTL